MSWTRRPAMPGCGGGCGGAGGRLPLLVTRSHGLEHRYWKERCGGARRGPAYRARTGCTTGRWRLREVAASLRASDACVFLNGDDRTTPSSGLRSRVSETRRGANGPPPEFLGLGFRPGGEPAAGGRSHVGSWTQRKGSRYLASALARVLGGHPAARVSLLGTGSPADAVLPGFPEPVRGRVDVVPGYRHRLFPRCSRVTRSRCPPRWPRASALRCRRPWRAGSRRSRPPYAALRSSSAKA